MAKTAGEEKSTRVSCEAAKLLDDPQREWLLLDNCIKSRPTHLLRTTPPTCTNDMAQGHDDLVGDLLQHILPTINDSHTTTSITKTTTKEGGLGLTDTHTTNHICYVSSITGCTQAIKHKLTAQGLGDAAEMFPACIPEYNASYTALVTAAHPHEKEFLKIMQSSTKESTTGTNLQSELNKFYGDLQLQARKTTFDEIHKALLQSASGPGAGAFLRTSPRKHRMNPQQFRSALARRLLLPQNLLLSQNECPMNTCKETMDKEGIHLSICPQTLHLQSRRHNQVRDFLAGWCSTAGLVNVITEQVVMGGRADIVAHGWGETGQLTLIIDVTVANALAPTVVGRYRAADRENEKLRTNVAIECERRNDTFAYVPFGVEVHGRLGPQALSFLQQLIHRCSLQGQIPQHSTHKEEATAETFYRGLSTTLQNSETYIIQQSMQQLHAQHQTHEQPRQTHGSYYYPNLTLTSSTKRRRTG